MLERVQLDITRTVTGARKGTSHEEIYKETNWKTLSERRKCVKLKMFMNAAGGEAPMYLQELVPKHVRSVRPSSRAANNYIIPKCRTETFKQSFIPSTVKLYNDLSKSDRTTKYGADISKSCLTLGNEVKILSILNFV